MSDYRDAGRGLIQGTDVPRVNQYGKAVAQPDIKIAPTGGSDGTPTPGGGGTPTLSLSAYVLSFSTKTGGANPPTQYISLTNSGTGTIAFTVGTTASWLVVTPASGTAPSTLALSVLNAGLVAGTYTNSFTITATGALGSPATVDVTLVVEADWLLPQVDPINKKAWLGYFKTATTSGEYTTTACTGAANACVVTLGDFGSNPEAANWATKQRTAAAQITALGGKIFIGTDEREILNMKSQWDQVGGIYTSMEGVTDSPTKVSALISATKTIIQREGLANKPFVTYIDSSKIPTLTAWIPGMNWLMLGAYLVYTDPTETSDSIRARAATLINGCMMHIVPLMPTDGKVVLAAQAYDRYNGITPDTWWDSVTLESLQKAYPDALRAYSQIFGIFWFAYDFGTTHGTSGYPNLIPWHKATKQAILGVPDTEIPASGPTGVLNVATTSTISGTAYDVGYSNQSIIVQIYDGPGVLGVNTNRIGQLSTNPVDYSFSMATPSSLLDGAAHSVWAYGVSKSSPVYQVALSGSPKVVQLTGGAAGMTTSGRSFLYAGAPFTWVGASAFMGIKNILNDGATGMDTELAYWASKGVTVLRVFGMIGNENKWAGWTFVPTDAGYLAAWHTLLTAAASKNIVIEACLFADTSVLSPYDTYASKLGFVKTFAAAMASHKNFVVEMCNEPYIEYNSGGTTIQQFAALATEYLKIDPTRIITLGAPDGDEDTSTNISPVKYAVIHSDRDPGWDWITGVFNPSNPNVSQGTIPCVDNEPFNATSSRSTQIDSDPARWYAYGLGCQLRQLSSTFHFGDGTYANLPDSATEDLLDLWLEGRTAIPWSLGGVYFNGTYPTVGTSMVFSNGQLLTMGRILSGTAQVLIVAPASGWTPSLRANWIAHLQRKVVDSTGAYAAYYYRFLG